MVIIMYGSCVFLLIVHPVHTDAQTKAIDLESWAVSLRVSGYPPHPPLPLMLCHFARPCNVMLRRIRNCLCIIIIVMVHYKGTINVIYSIRKYYGNNQKRKRSKTAWHHRLLPLRRRLNCSESSSKQECRLLSRNS